MNKAVFLDRDGIIINERGEYNYLPEHISFVDGIEDALGKLIEWGYILIIISNQGGIFLSLYGQRDAEKVNRIIKKHLSENGIVITEILYCPHHPSVSNCICRKPDSLLIEKAIYMYNLDANRSCFIGDQPTDIEAATKAGIKSIKVEPNDNLDKYIQVLSQS